jgi:hypothetical protein
MIAATAAWTQPNFREAASDRISTVKTAVSDRADRHPPPATAVESSAARASSMSMRSNRLTSSLGSEPAGACVADSEVDSDPEVCVGSEVWVGSEVCVGSKVGVGATGSAEGAGRTKIADAAGTTQLSTGSTGCRACPGIAQKGVGPVGSTECPETAHRSVGSMCSFSKVMNQSSPTAAFEERP